MKKINTYKIVKNGENSTKMAKNCPDFKKRLSKKIKNYVKIGKKIDKKCKKIIKNREKMLKIG